MYEIETIKFLHDTNVIIITIMDNDFRFSLSFYKEENNVFVNNNRLITKGILYFLIENGFVTRYAHHKYNYILQLTPKTLLLVL